MPSAGRNSWREAHPGVISALWAADLFGASTPFAKALLGRVEPLMPAGLLHLGSGACLALWLGLRRLDAAGRQPRDGSPARPDAPWLAGAILAGGVVGPALLTYGLTATAASAASVLLNLEGVFTALLAWFAFREKFDGRLTGAPRACRSGEASRP
jgi:drug/metabolite transporter (DMT)-like permease